MTTQDGKQIALDHMNRMSAGDIEGAAALMAEDCLNHSAIPEAQGRAGFRAIAHKLREAFPDATWQANDVIAEGDKVVIRMVFAGTHRGPLTFARLPLPATGRSVKTEQIHVLRIAGGKIVEHWMATDTIAMFRQLGLQVVPAA